MNSDVIVAAEELAPLAGRTNYQQVIQPVLIAGLVTSLLMGPVVVINVTSSRSFDYLPAVVFLIALEGVLTTRWLNHPDRRLLNRAAYRAAEFVVILLLLRVVAWVTGGNLPAAAELRNFLLNPMSFLDGTFFVLVLLALMTWERAIAFAAIFGRLVLGSDEVSYYAMPPAERRLVGGEMLPDSNRLDQVGRFLQQWTIGGIILLFCAAMTTYELPRLLSSGAIDLRSIGRLGLDPTMLAALLFYFLLGFWLLSQARLAAMRVRWLADGISTSPAVTRSWHRSSLLVVSGVALVASFLPIGSTFAFARILSAVLGFLFLIINLLFAVVAFLIYLVLSLFGSPQAGEETFEEVGQFTPPDLGGIIPPERPPSMLMGGLFWLVVVAVVGIAVVFFLRQRGVPVQQLFNGRLWTRLVSWWREMWGRFSGRVEELGRAVRTRLRPPAEAAVPPWRFVRLNALSPREQVRYFYLAMVRRAAERGVERKPAETPLEYVRDLQSEWPDAEVEMESLTDAFLEARYSVRPLEKEDVHPVKQTWQRVKSSLRKGKT